MAWPLGPDDETTATEPAAEKNLTKWTIYAKYKKSTVEKEFFSKDGQTIVVETGWRGGTFTITTNSDTPPEVDVKNEDELDIYSFYPDGVEEVELNETWDGCWMEVTWPDDMPEEERDRLQERFDEEGYYTVLEDEEGWMHSETEMWLVGPLVLEDAGGNVVADGDSEND